MVSKYRLIEPAFPSGRLKDKGDYRRILQLQFAGYSSAAISKYLALPPPTVNRILKKIRNELSGNASFQNFLVFEAVKADFHGIDNYSWFLFGALSAGRGTEEFGPEAFLECHLRCPRALSPRDYMKQIGGHYIDPYEFPYPQVISVRDDKWNDHYEQIEKKVDCRVCPFKESKRGLLHNYAQTTVLYPYIMSYFAQTRIRDTSEIVAHLNMIYNIVCVHLIALQRNGKANRRKLSEEATFFVVRKKMVLLADAAYASLSMRRPRLFDEMGQFIYSDGVGIEGTIDWEK